MKDEALKLALEALELHGKQYPHMVKGYCLDAITAIKQALAAPVQEPSLGGILFAVEEAIRNGDCPFAIEIAFDAYEVERRALAGITASPEKGQP